MDYLPSSFMNLVSIIVGLIVGSFINVVVVRLPKQQSLVRPGSHCTNCQTPIRWWDNIPVLSYFLLRGKCRSCHQVISVRYPVIELLTALLFLTVEIRFGWSPVVFLRDWPFVAILLAVTFIDLEHRIIPDPLSLGGLALGLATSWMVADPGWILSISGALLGFVLFFGLAWVYEKLSGRSGLGGGDIKLLAMVGAFLGPNGVFITILISSVFGSMVGIGWALTTEKKQWLRVSIPYGPFLVVGALCYYFLGDLLWFRFMKPI